MVNSIARTYGDRGKKEDHSTAAAAVAAVDNKLWTTSNRVAAAAAAAKMCSFHFYGALGWSIRSPSIRGHQWFIHSISNLLLLLFDCVTWRDVVAWHLDYSMIHSVWERNWTANQCIYSHDHCHNVLLTSYQHSWHRVKLRDDYPHDYREDHRVDTI